MKINISKSPIFAILAVAMLLELRFASIFNLPYLQKTANMSLVVVIISVLLFLNTVVNNHIYNTLKPYRNIINAFALVLLICTVVVIIYSYNKYGQTPRNYFSCIRTFFYFLLAPSFIFIMTKQNGYEYMMRFLLAVTIVYVVLCFINSFSYSLRGTLIWERLHYGIRNNRLRCQAPFSLVIVFPYVFNKIFTEKLKKDKAKWIAVTALLISFIQYICMTRMLTAALYAFIALSLVLLPKDPNVRKTILILYGIGLVVLIGTGRFSHIFNYIQAKDENLGDSAEARMNSMRYFQSIFEKNPWFSMGYVAPTTDYYRAIFSGPIGAYFFDDIGIINIPLHYGLIGTIPFAFYLVRVVYLMIKIYFFNKSPKKAYFLGMLVLITVSQGTLCIFDGQRIMGAIVLWALCEYEAYHTAPQDRQPKNRRISIRRNNENHTIQLRVDKSRRRSGVSLNGE